MCNSTNYLHYRCLHMELNNMFIGGLNHFSYWCYKPLGEPSIAECTFESKFLWPLTVNTLSSNYINRILSFNQVNTLYNFACSTTARAAVSSHV